jgi:hypothetical protein
MPITANNKFEIHLVSCFFAPRHVVYFSVRLGYSEKYMSRPLLQLLCGDIGFVYPAMSMVVLGPSLLHYNGIEIPEHSSGSELFFSLLNNK